MPTGASEHDTRGTPAVKALVQRVREASVTVAGEVVGATGHGLLILLGIAVEDNAVLAARLADKVANLRIFSDDAGKFNLSLVDVGGGALVVSQFTLLADTRKGNRPSFIDAAPPSQAEPLVECFAEQLGSHGIPIAMGKFGAHMQVALINDGPVTIMLDTGDWSRPRRG